MKLVFFWLLSMVIQPGTSQCCLKVLNTSKTKQNKKPQKTASVPSLDQFHGIILFPPPRTLADFTSSISNPFWLSVSHQNYHQLKLASKVSFVTSQSCFPQNGLPGFDLDEEVFPMSTQRKLLPHFWHPSWGKLVQCYRCGVLVFSSLIACLQHIYFFMAHGVGIMLVEVKRGWQIPDHVHRENRVRTAANLYGIWFWKYWIFRNILAPFGEKRLPCLSQLTWSIPALAVFNVPSDPKHWDTVWGSQLQPVCSNKRDQRVNQTWLAAITTVWLRMSYHTVSMAPVVKPVTLIFIWSWSKFALLDPVGH